MAALRTHHPIAPFAFLAPAAAVLGVFFLLSMLQVVYFSFTRYAAFSPAEPVGFDNYRQIFTTRLLFTCLLNSAAYLLVTPAIIAISLLAALAVDARLRGLGWLRLALFLPVVTPTVVAALAWRLLYNEDSGMLNSALRAVGLDGVRWLSERPWTLISAMIVTLWKGFGFYMMVFLAALMGVPRELKEAAAIDGAGRFAIFRNVILPSIRPAVVLVFVISSISALKVFDEVFVTIGGTPMTHQTVVPLIYQLAFERGQFGLASAVGVTLFVLILTFSLVNLRLSRERRGAA